MKMLLRAFLLLVLSATGNAALAQPFDTLRVMHYNLTNYGNIIDGCTSATNGLTLKNPEFKTIMKHAMPDLLGVCEVNTNPSIATNFLNNVLNTDGITAYKKSNFQTEPSGTITSVLYYNGDKMVLANQSFAPTQVRRTHHFRLYLKTTGLPNGDTIWINVLAGHFKAGNTTPDANDRASMTTAIRTYLNSFSKNENCILMGDFNFYRSSETGFQNLIAANPKPTYQFLDPVNRIGSWGSNASFADVHSQCPSTNYNSGCYSGGGLDDRFDFILMNRHLINDSAKLRYISGTYKALGNDGQHYNKNITDSPTNTSAPLAVLTSLYKASDHLPIVARLRVNGTLVTGTNEIKVRRSFGLQPQAQGLLVTGLEDGETVDLSISDTQGKILWKGSREVRDAFIDLPEVQHFSGLIFVKAISRQGKTSGLQILKGQN